MENKSGSILSGCTPRVLEHKSIKESESCSVALFATPWTAQSMEFPGQSTGVGSLSLLLGIFPAQESNPGLPHCRQILYQLSHQGSLRILAWVVYPFSSGSSWPRNRTRVSCIASIFFIIWATREAHEGRTSTILAYLGQNNFQAVSLTLWTTATLFGSQLKTVSPAVESVGFGIMRTWYWPRLSYSVLLHGIFIQTYMSMTHQGPCEECILTIALRPM